MIRKAQPKEGLETGGLTSGSEAAHERIAREYEDDLSGKNGPTARFDTLRELINTEIGAAQNEMTFASGDGSQIFGRGGRFAVLAPSGKRTKAGVTEETAADNTSPWSITSNGSATISLVAGTVIDIEDLTSALTITDSGSTFAVGNGDYLWLKLEYDSGTSSYTITLESGSSWSGHPKGYEITGSGATAEWVSTSYLLYSFTTTFAAGLQAIGSGVYAKRLIGDHNLSIIGTNYQTGTNRPAPGFTFLPYHGAA